MDEELEGMLEEAMDDEEEAIEYYAELLVYMNKNGCSSSMIEKIECIKKQEEEHLAILEQMADEL
jgi:rubrerythrin